MPLLCCLDRSFILTFEIRKCKSSNFVFLKIVPGSPAFLYCVSQLLVTATILKDNQLVKRKGFSWFTVLEVPVYNWIASCFGPVVKQGIKVEARGAKPFTLPPTREQERKRVGGEVPESL
jgi:hypothetical protein